MHFHFCHFFLGVSLLDFPVFFIQIISLSIVSEVSLGSALCIWCIYVSMTQNTQWYVKVFRRNMDDMCSNCIIFSCFICLDNLFIRIQHVTEPFIWIFTSFHFYNFIKLHHQCIDILKLSLNAILISYAVSWSVYVSVSGPFPCM
jgi:hypothetical protein